MQASKMGTSQLGKTKNNYRQSPASKPSNVWWPLRIQSVKKSYYKTVP
jgi:hypothetical protein